MGEAKRRRDAATDIIAKHWSDHGRLIEGGWLAALSVLQWSDRPEAERRELRLAFYAGAQHLFGSMMGILDEDREPTMDDLRRMDGINKELEAFAHELAALLGEPGGRS